MNIVLENSVKANPKTMNKVTFTTNPTIGFICGRYRPASRKPKINAANNVTKVKIVRTNCNKPCVAYANPFIQCMPLAYLLSIKMFENTMKLAEALKVWF